MLLPDPTADPLADDQSRMNRSTRGQWDWYASHRRRIERLIVPTGRGQRICVLGAGNCNDLDLRWLVEAYAEVHLVDIDRSALERAAARQGVEGHARLRFHAPADLTGIADVAGGWRGRRAADADVDAACRQVEAIAPHAPGGGGFDLVLSPCVLSQLLVGTRDLIGKDHAGWPRLKAALRARHLRDMVGAARAGGRAVLVIDLTSTGAVPGLDRAGEGDLEHIRQMSVRDGKCFRGLEPPGVMAGLRSLDGVERVGLTPSWLWHLGWGKAFLVYAAVVSVAASGRPLVDPPVDLSDHPSFPSRRNGQ
jgi:hypothetical protein